MTPNQVYKKAMVVWAREIAKWQIDNPEKDWATELFGATTQDDGPGTNPPPPPPPKPGT